MDKQTRAECCTDVPSESGCRNNYFDGKRLSTDSFRVEQRYFLDRRRLLNRAIFGWGVVYGFAVTASAGKLQIGPGLALDPCGRELLGTATKLELEDLAVLDEKGTRLDRKNRAIFDSGDADGGTRRVCWLLSAHYAEQSSGPVTVEDNCNCSHKEYERVCETVRYSLRRIPCGDCCRGDECEIDCGCATGPCCDDDRERKRRDPDRRPKRGGCRCICDYLTNLDPTPGDCGLCEIDDPCGRVRADLRNGVPLACVTITEDERGCPELGEIDPCGPRRLVKRNDLLFDLIQGCDLTRISEIGWKDWHRREEPVPFDDFSQAFGEPGKDEYEVITRDFWVRFSRPVRLDTVRPDCFVMRAMTFEREGGWWMALRVPIVRVETAADAGDPPDHVSKATIVVDRHWLKDAVRSGRTLFVGNETRIEIEIRGDFIVDCNGQTVDANAVGLIPPPTGNGSPGGTFISTFRVAATHSYATSERGKGVSS
jgi:hypothetical protein